MAFFKRTPTIEENCVMVLEAKGLGSALSDVLDQPKAYVESLKLTNVKHILTTNRENLFVYEKSDNEWISNPTGLTSDVNNGHEISHASTRPA